MCWFVYMGGGITELRARSRSAGQAWGPRLMVRDHDIPGAQQFQGSAFRHFVFQVNPNDAARPLGPPQTVVY